MISFDNVINLLINICLILMGLALYYIVKKIYVFAKEKNYSKIYISIIVLIVWVVLLIFLIKLYF